MWAELPGEPSGAEGCLAGDARLGAGAAFSSLDVKAQGEAP